MATEGFVRAYTARTPRSRALWEEARGVLPGGVGGNAKFFKPHPIYIEKASGSRAVDVDGNVYIDLLCGAGSAILGNGPEAVTPAVATQLRQAISPIFAAELEIRLAKRVTTHMRYLEMERFVNSGSEASFLWRARRGPSPERERIGKFEGNYHGQHDFGLGGASSWFGVRPDLGAIGKIVGGGLPIGAFGGRRDIMEKVVTPTKESSDVKEKIFFHVHFAGDDKRSAMRADPARQYAFSIGMISKGVLLPPAHPGFLSTGHSEADVDEVLRVAGNVLREMAC